MALGDAFPASFKAAAIKHQLKPGAVVKIESVMDDGEVHEKRFVILHVDKVTSTFICVINSKVSKIIASNPAASRCQVIIDQKSPSLYGLGFTHRLQSYPRLLNGRYI